MNLLQQFVAFLLNQKVKPSLLTVKNYKSDIRQFISWFNKEFNSPFDPAKVTLQILQNYKQTRRLSGSSMERHTSSLRKFFNFLKAQKIIAFDLFPAPNYQEKIEADPWMLKNFKSFLYEYKKSNLTIKNYINDVKSFFVWLGKAVLVKYAWDVADRNLLGKINFSVIAEYKQRLIAAKFSPRTINRKLSSLRSYISWAKSQGVIPEHSESQNVSPSADGSDNQTVKSSDSLSVPDENSRFPPVRLVQKSLRGINFVFDNLFILPLAQTLQATEYFFWKVTGKKIFKKDVIPKSQIIQPDEISNIKREFYAPLNVSTRYLPIHKRIWHYLRFVRPNWYKKYHSYSFTHYFHFAILTILSCAVGFGIYNGLFADTQKENAILGDVTSASPRILSFQGKLTDSADSPITKETTILFSFYSDEDASAKAALWQENNIVKPDSDGVFSVLLGKNTPIPHTAFSQNSRLFLGITLGNSPELKPRQELATVHLTSNSETLQGLEPITNTAKVSNVILALDSSGNLSIAGAKAHTFQATGGNLVLSGKVLSLTTVPGSNSNIEIVPDGIGKIDLSKPIQNSTNNNNLISAAGSVEFDDTVAILATTSAQAALYINQNATGALISASTSGIAKFVVENDGTGRFTGGLAVNGGDLFSAATTFNLLNSTVTTLNLGGAATDLVLGATTGTITIRNASAAIQGNITLGDAATDTITFTGRVAQDSDLIPIGTTGTNDLGSSSLPWDNAYIDNIYSASTGTSGHWQRNAQALSPTNISDDILTGANATSSALIKLSGTSGNNSWINTGNVGIGTTAPSLRLDIRDSQLATAAAQIFNTSTGTDADGLIVKLGNTNSIVANTNRFISFETSGIGIVGSIRGSGTGVQYQTNGIADFAEYFRKDKDQAIEYGSVVCLKDNGLAVKCSPSAGSGQDKIIGVASERPAFLGGENLGDGSVAVGLVGQVETFVTTVNGEIKAGDVLTVSDIPGVAVKATKAGQIIGKALEDLSPADEAKVAGYFDPVNQEYASKASFPNIPLKSNIVRVAKIYVLVNVSWYDPSVYLAQNGELIINSTGADDYFISNSNNEVLTNIGGFLNVIAANIKTGIINASEIVTQSLIVTSDSIIVNGQNLRDYIVNVVKDSLLRQDFGGQAGITSPVVNTDRLSANFISPLGQSLIVRLATPSAEIHNSEFIIQNSSGSAVVRIDDQGNASFSGTINSLSLKTNDASISGTLRAGKILADEYVNLASYSASLSNIPDLAAERAQFNQGLMVFGPTSLSDLSIAGRLSIGSTMFITENSIETLGTDLSLQSLRQGGLSIMAGLVYVDTEGNIKIQGDLSVKGKLAVSNASGSNVLSINQAGDITASGSGTFAKLNFSFVAPVLAVSETEVIASSSAGVANVAPYQTEVTIRNALVTNKSVIYITPVGTPSAQTPFLMRQIPNEPVLSARQSLDEGGSGTEGSFTIGVESPNKNPIPFNWLIVN